MLYVPVIHEEEKPELIGELNIRYGINGFVKAEIGHPVFIFRDRYVIFLTSLTELRERMFDPKLGGDRTYVGFFQCMIPFYKETLNPFITFSKDNNNGNKL